MTWPWPNARSWRFSYFTSLETSSNYPLVNVHITMENSPFQMDKSTISMAIFNSKLLNYQRLNLHFPMVFLWLSYGLPEGNVKLPEGIHDGFPIAGQDSAPLVVEVSGSHGSIWVAHCFLISSFSDATNIYIYIYITHEILCVYIYISLVCTYNIW